jgi:carbonic anhydrase
MLQAVLPITLAEQVLENIPRKTKWANHISDNPEELEILSERIDPAPGTHKVKYSSGIDDIEIIHTAHTRKGFALGAVLAAEFLKGKKGIYSMKEVLGCKTRLFINDKMKFLVPIILFISMFSACKQKQEKDQVNTLAPLDNLKTGNERFVSGHPVHPDETLDRIRELKKGQNPFVVVVSCSDSRLPPELIFDQGLGDVFSIRTAGNVIGDYELGSIEYAIEHLHCKLIVVLGHENCGAIQAYATSGNEKHNDHIQTLVDYIAAEEEEKIIPDSLRSNIDILVKANIAHAVNLLRSSTPVLKPLVDKNEIKIIGAYYDLDSGNVLFDK